MRVEENGDAVRLAQGAISMTRWGYSLQERECRRKAMEIRESIAELQDMVAAACAAGVDDKKEPK